MSDEPVFRKVGHQVSVPPVFDPDGMTRFLADWRVSAGRGQLYDMLASGKFQPQHLDPIREQSPAAGVCGFAGFPENSGGVERETGQRVVDVGSIFGFKRSK